MKSFTLLSLLAMAALSVMVFVGCETESANAPVHINPSAATVREGESVTFTADGGYDYKWSLSEGGLGHLSASTGPSTVYTSVSGEAGQQTLTLTSTIDGVDAGSSTNSFSYNKTTTAIITHLGEEEESDPDSDTVAIHPATATTATGNETVHFIAVGNGSNYRWSRSHPALGSLSSSSGSSTAYTAVRPGTQTITLTYTAPDGSAKVKTAKVTQS